MFVPSGSGKIGATPLDLGSSIEVITELKAKTAKATIAIKYRTDEGTSSEKLSFGDVAVLLQTRKGQKKVFNWNLVLLRNNHRP